MICNVPGFTEEKAVAVVSKYRSVHMLMLAYQNLNNEIDRENLLEGLDVLRVNHKEKDLKLGKLFSKKIYRFIFSMNEEEILWF